MAALTVWHTILLNAYGGLWRVATPLLRRHKRLREGFSRRLAPDDWLAGTPSPAAVNAGTIRIWMQAASGGEARLLHSLAPALVRAFAAQTETASFSLDFLCTACTRQGLDVLESLAEKFKENPLQGVPAIPLRILPCYFPLDRPDVMEKALDMAAPHAVLLLETELWPGLLAGAKRRDIPVFVLNGRMTEKSLSGYTRIASFWRECAPKKVLAVSLADAERFSRLFAMPEGVSVMRNIKFDGVAEMLVQEAAGARPHPDAAPGDVMYPREMAGMARDTLLMALASVREEEEDLLVPLVRSMYGRTLDKRSVVIAVAPRHLHRVDAWEKKLRSAGMPCMRRSTADKPAVADGAAHQRIWLWDTFGELQTLYALADAVFVGGSLAPLGGQNFLEALGQGIVPVVGPHVENFHWVGEDIFTTNLARQVREPHELFLAMEEILLRRSNALAGAGSRAALRRKVRDRFAAWLAPRVGGAWIAAETVAKTMVPLFTRLEFHS